MVFVDTLISIIRDFSTRIMTTTVVQYMNRRLDLRLLVRLQSRDLLPKFGHFLILGLQKSHNKQQQVVRAVCVRSTSSSDYLFGKMSLQNTWYHRKVADSAAKSCWVCFKPSTSVLITPDNKVRLYQNPSLRKLWYCLIQSQQLSYDRTSSTSAPATSKTVPSVRQMQMRPPLAPLGLKKRS
jgi:hypothetical protein